MPIVRSPCTLLWPRTGQAPAPGLPMLPRRSRKLTISWIVATAALCWVSPIAQQTIDALGRRRPCRPADRRPPASSPVAASSSEGSSWRRWAARASQTGRCGRAMKSLVDRAGLEQPVVEELEQREVARRPGPAGRGRPARCPARLRPARRLRVLEADEARLGQRVDGDDLRAAALRQLQRGEHARVVGAGVLADHEDEVGLLDVVEGDRALADADRLAERRRRSTRGTCSSSPAGCSCRTARTNSW